MPETGGGITKLSGKRDLVLVAAILLIAAVLFGFNYISRKKPAVTAQITVDGKVAKILDLGRDAELIVIGVSKGINHFIVRDGETWCSEASCPNKVCVYQGKKYLSSDAIVCLPNKMIVTIIGDE